MVMKFGGTSVAGAEEIKRAAARIVAAREAGSRVVAVLSARGKTTDELSRGGLRDLRAAGRPRDGHAALDRRADLLRALRDGDPRHGPRGDLADRLAGRDRHRLLPHQGADHRRPRRSHPRGARRGPDRARRRLPGRLDREPRRDHARAGRIRHHRGRARRRAAGSASARSTPTSRGVFSADPRIVPGARKLRDGLLRGDARDVGLGRQGAAAALGRVRAQPRRPDPLPQQLRGRPRYPRPPRGRDDGTAAGNRRHPLRRRGSRDADRRSRRARRRRAHLRRPGRRPTSTST